MGCTTSASSQAKTTENAGSEGRDQFSEKEIDIDLEKDPQAEVSRWLTGGEDSNLQEESFASDVGHVNNSFGEPPGQMEFGLLHAKLQRMQDQLASEQEKSADLLAQNLALKALVGTQAQTCNNASSGDGLRDEVEESPNRSRSMDKSSSSTNSEEYGSGASHVSSTPKEATELLGDEEVITEANHPPREPSENDSSRAAFQDNHPGDIGESAQRQTAENGLSEETAARDQEVQKVADLEAGPNSKAEEGRSAAGEEAGAQRKAEDASATETAEENCKADAAEAKRKADATAAKRAEQERIAADAADAAEAKRKADDSAAEKAAEEKRKADAAEIKRKADEATAKRAEEEKRKASAPWPDTSGKARSQLPRLGSDYVVTYPQKKLGIWIREADLKTDLPIITEVAKGTKLPLPGHCIFSIGGVEVAGDSNPYQKAMRLIQTPTRPLKIGYMKTDHWKSRNAMIFLGLDQGFTQKELKRAYYKAALRWHPDRSWALQNPGRKEQATLNFTKACAAFDLLQT
mmetsp:Transcript_44403/g.100397  ORF Transcript_44403/g.100397 Transcript_44403/m.100397 type:complete len:520 (+) Transcript_44403:294-1853(+)|eukprot:CAMPEP_0172629710 /NCGR_PEP_ID=MMETSP1068-20121228/169427_1 /TAXON_ID=35684 /ORGANISM="Pseudopedinella elastica, Strain CCMP716" /LENGTH=519 /DNA_ID=CAMNT_0013440337 /DNA_START=287 /DNA_END=1846 /DNA_ORIENTATION=-